MIEIKEIQMSNKKMMYKFIRFPHKLFKDVEQYVPTLDIDEYANLLKMAELLEDYTIMEMVKERDQLDDGTRFTSDEVTRMRQEMKATQCL